MRTTVISPGIVILGVVLFVTAVSVAWFVERQRGGSLSGRTVTFVLLPLVALAIVFAIGAASSRGIEFALIAGVVLIGLGIAVYLARHRDDPRLAGQNRTMILLLGLAAVGLILSVIGQAVR